MKSGSFSAAMVTTLILLVLLSCTESYVLKSNTSPLVELSDYLMDGYHKGVRPKKNWRETTTVYIEVAINAILELGEKNQIVKSYILYNQSWVDEFLQWDPVQFDNITHIYLPTDSIWTPDIMIEEVVGTAESADIPFTYVNSKGIVFKSNPIHITTSCSMHIYYFPFDLVNCSLSFRSWLHSTQDINITFLRPPKDMIRLPSDNEGEWEIVSVVPGYHILADHNLQFGQIKFYLGLRRRPLFYIVNLILPSILLMIMDIIGFYIPVESGERLSFKITLLLGYSVFLLIVSDTLPAAGAPLIGVYFALCMVILLLSLTESILIVRSFHQKNRTPEVPKWLKILLLEKIAVFISIKDREQSEASNSGTCFQNENVSSETHPTYNNMKESECYLPTQLKMVYAKHLEVLNHIAEEITRIRVHLKTTTEQNNHKEWQRVAYVLDTLLFRVYLVLLVTYTVSIVCLWSR